MQKGLSPKVVADFIVTVAAFAFANFAINIDPEYAAAAAKVLGSFAGYLTPPGQVVTNVGEPNDPGVLGQ